MKDDRVKLDSLYKDKKNKGCGLTVYLAVSISKLQTTLFSAGGVQRP